MSMVGIDVGGTFTDLILARDDASTFVAKSPTTREDESIGVIEGLRELAVAEARAHGIGDESVSVPELLASIDTIVHATTTADNTLIEMDGSPTGLITSLGHRDEIELRRGWKEKIWDPTFARPPEIAKRRFRIGVPERLDHKGNVLTELDENAVRRAARRFREHGVSSVAIVFLFSFIDASHELRAAEIVAEEFPDARISLSHEVMPSAPEFERTSTTLVNAFVGPRVVDYLDGLDERLRAEGFTGRLLVMQSNGGIDTLDAVRTRPITTLASGPVGGVSAAAAVAGTEEARDFISVDMGGTSYDVCLVRDGRPAVKTGWNWVARYCIGLPMVDVLSVGAGGGSLARVQAGGLRVGPESAGSEPGPVCYGRGGKQVTVTDANVMLGYLNPDNFAGGTMRLDTGGLETAMREQIAVPLGLGTLEAAAGIHRLTNAEMNNAIRRVSSERGFDPRKLPLVAFGGNGAVHAPAQMADLGFPAVIVPRTAAALSALGVLLADFVVDVAHAQISRLEDLDPARATQIFAELATTAAKDLSGTGIDQDRHEYQYSAACRYPGQTFSIDVPVALDGQPAAPVVTESTLDKLAGAFHTAHEELHTFSTPDEAVIVSELQLRAIGRTEKPRIDTSDSTRASLTAKPQMRRPAYFDGEMTPVDVYAGNSLTQGSAVAGPAIIEEPYTTIVIQPDQQATVDDFDSFVIRSTS